MNNSIEGGRACRMNDPSMGAVFPARVLVVDDEPVPRMTITRALNLMGYWADEAASGVDALRKLASRYYDLMLLDLRMPGLDGVEVMRRAHSLSPDTLVIILTAHATLDSAIAAVRSDAADYLLKPHSIRDTAAAIARALENRPATRNESGAPDARLLQRGPLTLDLETRNAVVSLPDGTTLEAALTANEAALLTYLMQYPDKVCSCRDLARSPLGYDVSGPEAEDIVRPHISRLRNKVEMDPARPALIRTIRGKGYVFSIR
jgi:DNA-binding response OmpR family regulator